MAFDPNDIYSQTQDAGSTLLPSQAMTPKVSTNEVQFKDASIIRGVSQKYTDNQYFTVPSSFALWEGLQRLQKNINQIDPDNNFFKDNSVVSLPLIDPHFSLTEEIPWIINSWNIVDGQAVYQGVGNNDNELKISQEVFTFPSYYHLNIVVERIDSGKLLVLDHLNRVVIEITKIGEYNIEMYIADPDLTTLRLQATNVYIGDIIKVDSVNLHIVAERFRDYFVSVLKNGNLVVGIDADQATVIASTLINTAVDNLSVVIASIRDELIAHEMDKDNPHEVTPEKIGAAAKNHTHNELGTVTDIFDAFQIELNELLKRLNDLTPEDIGAAKADHTHTPEEIGAAPEIHYHDDTYLRKGDVTDLANQIKDILNNTNSNVSTNNEAFIVTPGSMGRDGVYPPGSEGTEMSPTGVILRFPYNLHTSSWDYDPIDGLAECNTETTDASYAALAFSDYYGKSADFNKLPSVSNPVILKYTFTGIRKVSGYRVYKSPDSHVKGFASKWAMSIDGVLCDEVNNSSWADMSVNKTRCFPQSFSDEHMVHEVVFEITEAINTDGNTDWGIRISFDFTDVEFTRETDTEVGFIAETIVSYPESTPATIFGNFLLEMNTLAPVNNDIPSWLYLTRNILRDETGNKIGTTYEPFFSFIEPEFSEIQKGIPYLMDKYGIDEIFGELTSNSTPDSGNVISNIFNTNPKSYWKSLQSSLIQIEYTTNHSFRIPGVVSIGLRWNTAHLKSVISDEYIPKSVRLTFTGSFYSDEGNLMEGSKVVLTEPNLVVTCRKNEQFAQVNLSTKEMESFTKVKSIKMELNYNGNRENQSSVALSEFIIYYKGWWAPKTNQAGSDPDVIPLGRIELASKMEDSLIEKPYGHIGFPMGKIMGIPINYFKYSPAGEYSLPNPFMCTDLTISPFSTALDDTTETYGLNSVDVLKVTVTEILVRVNFPGKYGLKVVRQW